MVSFTGHEQITTYRLPAQLPTTLASESKGRPEISTHCHVTSACLKKGVGEGRENTTSLSLRTINYQRIIISNCNVKTFSLQLLGRTPTASHDGIHTALDFSSPWSDNGPQHTRQLCSGTGQRVAEDAKVGNSQEPRIHPAFGVQGALLALPRGGQTHGQSDGFSLNWRDWGRARSWSGG